MKKIFTIIISLILILNLVSCQKKSQNGNYENIITNFTSNVTISMEGELYACTYTRNNNQTSKLKIDSPNEISGLNFEKNPQGYKASLEGIDLSDNQEKMPALSLIKILDTILDSIENNNEIKKTTDDIGRTVLKGEDENYKFEVTVLPQNNFIEKINIINNKAEFMFFNQKVLN